jgi:arsenite/tail-anchored protein-transporting ATPase
VARDAKGLAGREKTGPRLSFFGGKGGVGKTTCAAAAAVRAASEGQRVLVVSTDPAHSLGDALGIQLGAEPRRVRRARGELYAAELDADKALGRWLRQRREAIQVIADRGTYLDEEDIDRLLSLSFPGVDELVGLVELVRLAHVMPFDVVVVDTAPTGHTLRLLAMPDTLARLAQVLDDMHAKHRFLASSIGGRWRPDFADETIAEIEREASGLHDLLADRSRSTFTWVMLPEEMSARESEDGVRALDVLGVRVDVIVVNRVLPSDDRACAHCASRVDAEHVWRKWVDETFAGRTLLEVPVQSSEPRGVEALFELAGSVRQLDVRSTLAANRRARVLPAPDVKERLRRVQASKGIPVASPIPTSARLALVGGKGGVGKTTVAAALAIELAVERPRERILLLSTDPAHSLGDVLGANVSDEARPALGAPSNLEVRELDAARAWEIERTRYREAIDDLFSSIFRGRLDASFDRAVLEDLLDLAPPGIDELLALVTLLDALVVPARERLALRGPKDAAGEEHPAKGYDVVVVDTAPTGHTLRLLELPQSALAWVHALMSIILKYRNVVGLGEVASDLTQLARRLRTLTALLVDPARCAFVVVTRPAALPRLETEQLVSELERLRVPLAALVVNAVADASCPHCADVAKRERPELERLHRLAGRAAARMVLTPAVYPGPRGARQLRSWRQTWSERGASA